MDFHSQQIAPPKSWDTFEEVTRALFAAVWGDPSAQRHGRTGQAQHGVDVFGSPKSDPGMTRGVQCKGKSGVYGAAATVEEFDAELAKAESFAPSLNHWTFATTAPNDAVLQRHAAAVSERRFAAGQFPVAAIGWDTFVSMLSAQPSVIEQFYPEQSSVLQQVLAAVAGSSAPAALPWVEVRFDAQRDLGPALMGRSLGPADVGACPVLPETESLLHELRQAGSARLTGVAGAGKSICTLQVGRALRAQGWRIFRVTGPTSGLAPPAVDPARTLYIVDDAHLMGPGLLRAFEDGASETQWILSAHTSLEGKAAAPGTIHLDAKRAVKVIASGLRATPGPTLAAVQKADDRVGPGLGHEPLDVRLDQAEKALFPWQFCFILGGGWRRAKSLASSAKAAGADRVLAAAAIRQLASRDAPCSLQELKAFLGDQLDEAEVDSVVDWLVGQRLVLGKGDLRCPHQRFAGVLLDQILSGQDPQGLTKIASVLRAALVDPAMPLGGLALLLGELWRSSLGRWSLAVDPEWLDPMLARAWAATAPQDVLQACWALNEVHSYHRAAASIADHRDILISWVEGAPNGACYALGRLVNQTINDDEAFFQTLAARISPEKIARAISAADPLHACEIAELISNSRLNLNPGWTVAYLAAVDKAACLRLMATWPTSAPLSMVADYCKHFTYADEALGCDLIEALTPAIADRLRADPAGAFHELNDIVWHSLRLYDPLGIYVGANRPSQRMRRTGRLICSCWSPTALAEKLSASDERTFQPAAGVLELLRKASPRMFVETIEALDWDQIDAAIGASWAHYIGDARMLFGVAWQHPPARSVIQRLIAQNEYRIVTLTPRLAAMAPETALRHLEAGKTIALAGPSNVEWNLGVLVLARVWRTKSSLLPALMEPHYASIAGALSQQSPSFWKDALSFLWVLADVDGAGLQRVLGGVDPSKAAIGWRNGLQGTEVHGKAANPGKAREVAALLVYFAIDRKDALGDVARSLRRSFPKRSTPSAKTLEPLDWTAPLD